MSKFSVRARVGASRSFLLVVPAVASICLWGAALTFADEPAPSAKPSLDTLAWMAGSWVSDDRGIVVEEQWLTPRGGMMLGVNRTVSSRGATQFEFLRMVEKDGGVTYYASPSGRPATPFIAKLVSKERAVFENPDVDFPNKIEYWREDDRLRARIEGKINGAARSMEWTWKRAAAPPANP